MISNNQLIIFIFGLFNEITSFGNHGLNHEFRRKLDYLLLGITVVEKHFVKSKKESGKIPGVKNIGKKKRRHKVRTLTNKYEA